MFLYGYIFDQICEYSYTDNYRRTFNDEGTEKRIDRLSDQSCPLANDL